jgi:hypothetical protein
MKKLAAFRTALVLLCLASLYVCWYHTRPAFMNLVNTIDSEDWIMKTFTDIAKQRNFQEVIGLKTTTWRAFDPTKVGDDLPYECITVNVDTGSQKDVSGAGIICDPINPPTNIYDLQEVDARAMSTKLAVMYIDAVVTGMERSCQKPEMKKKCEQAHIRITHETKEVLTAMTSSGLFLALAKEAKTASLKVLFWSTMAFLGLLLVIGWQIAGFCLAVQTGPKAAIIQGGAAFFKGESLTQAQNRFDKKHQEAEYLKSEAERLIKASKQFVKTDGSYAILETVTGLVYGETPESTRIGQDKACKLINLNLAIVEQAKKERTEARRDREARELFLASAGKFGSDTKRKAENLYDTGDYTGARALVAKEEEKQQRPATIEALRARAKACQNSVARMTAFDRLDEADSMLDAKAHDWRRKIYEVEEALSGQLRSNT